MYTMKQACELTNMNYETLKFYCNQGLILLILLVLSGAIGAIPLIGWLLGLAVNLYIAVSIIAGLVYGFQGQAKKLLWIGSIEIIK